MKTHTGKLLSFAMRKAISAFMVTVVLVSLVMISVLITQGTAAHAATSPITLSLTILKEKRTAEADGTTKVEMVPVNGAVPGDRLIYRLTYTNTGAKSVSDVVLNYPMPENVSYRAAAEGSLAPELSKDGDVVRALSWRVPGEIAPGAHGEVTFKATLN